ncbi:MAG TPA: class I SAM-dependent methyltransferase, partial [Opitutaceae bacterium]
MRLISVHIPETAGGLFGELLVKQFAQTTCLHYYHPYDAHWKRLSEIPVTTEYLHGHFLARQFRQQNPDAFLVSWMRDPAERVAAEYERLKNEPDPNSELSQMIANGATLLDFAEHAFARNTQTRYIDSLSPSDFKFLGISENFAEELGRFSAVTGTQLPVTTKALKPISLPPEVRQQLVQLNGEDEQLYRQACDIAKSFVFPKAAPIVAKQQTIKNNLRSAEGVETEYFQRYVSFWDKLKVRMGGNDAYEAAVGGDFLAVGKLELAVLKKFGLTSTSSVVDAGCGSGRLAVQLAPFPQISYLGTDVVPALLDYARKIVDRPDWRFETTDGIAIPTADNSADFITFFSVFTHITHEDCYRYLEESKRVIKPGGKIIVSFLEFRIRSHWEIFRQSLLHRQEGDPMNIFMDRDGLNAWANDLELEVLQIIDGDKPEIPIEEEITW